MRVLVNGSAVGENEWEQTADGTITSNSSLDLGAIKASSSVLGHIKNGKLLDATVNGTSPGGTIKVVYAKGRVDVTAQGKTNGAPWTDTTGALAGNLHPQFFASSMLIAEKAIQASSANKSTSVNAYFVDSGVVLPIKVTLKQPVTVTVEGEKKIVRHFGAEAVGSSFDIYLDPANRVVAEDIPSQKLRLIADGFEGIFVDPMAKFPELSQATYKTKTEKGVHMKMRDGADLVCDVVRPDDDLKHPAILIRSPCHMESE